MSQSGGDPGRREVAIRLFASEFDDADLSYSESDEERAPNYVLTPTGARVNRLFVVGVLIEVETVSEDYLRARVVDPTGPFVVYAGQYQPDALAFLDRADTPSFVAVTGKARTYQPDDSDQVFTSIRPESVSTVDAATRDRWVAQTAARTLDRVTRMAEAKESGLGGIDLRDALEAHDVGEGLAAGIPVALDHYGTSGEYLAGVRDVALDSARVVAGELDEAGSLTAAPDAGGDGPLASLVERPIDVDVVETTRSTDEADETSDSEAGTEDGIGSTEDGTMADAGDDVIPAEPDDGTREDVEGDRSENVTMESDGVTDFEPEFELDDDEREAIEEEYGTEFQSASEVDEPGSADIQTPEPTPESESAASSESSVSSDEATTRGADESEATAPDDGDTDAVDSDDSDAVDPDDTDLGGVAAADVDLEDAVVESMGDLDDGDGASRDSVMAAVADRTGADPDAVEDAIQDALMDGRCYEPDDATLKPI